MLKSTGIVRRVDEVGRFVLPIELREVYGIDARTQLEIFTNGDQIVLRKYQAFCIFCGHGGRVLAFQGKTVCHTCQASLSQAGT